MKADSLKLLLKKAIFTGNTFIKHTENIGELIENVTDDSLIDIFESDEEAFKLLNQWEDVREKLVSMATEE